MTKYSLAPKFKLLYSITTTYYQEICRIAAVEKEGSTQFILRSNTSVLAAGNIVAALYHKL